METGELLDATTITPENFEIVRTDSAQSLSVETVRYFPLYNSIYVYSEKDSLLTGDFYRVKTQNVSDVNGNNVAINQNILAEAEMVQNLYGMSLVYKRFYKEGALVSGIPTGECVLEACVVNSAMKAKSGYVVITSTKSGELFRELITLQPDERKTLRYNLNIGTREEISVRFVEIGA